MKIFVTAKPNKKEEKVKKIRLRPSRRLREPLGSERGAQAPEGENCFEVWVKEPAKEGRANKAIIKLLARYFNIPLSKIILKSGAKSKRKVFEIAH